MSIAEASLLLQLIAEGIRAAVVAGRDSLTPEETAKIKAAQEQAEKRWQDLLPPDQPGGDS